MRRLKTMIGLVFSSLAATGAAQAQTTPYGVSGTWVVTQSDGKLCSMTRGTKASMISLARYKDGQLGLGFWITRATPVPKLLPVTISYMDVPFSKQETKQKKVFTHVVSRRTNVHFLAPVTDAEAELFRSHRFVAFTEIVTNKRPYSFISAANEIGYEAAAEQMVKECVASLK